MTEQPTRLGVVVPSSNTTVERELAATLPGGVSFHAARMPLQNVTVEELDAMADDAVAAAERLAHADVDVVAYACTTGSLLHGPGFDTQLEADLSAATDAPAVATARSVKRALDALDAGSVALVTPYTDDLNDREVDFLEAEDVTVTSVDGRGIEANTEIGALTPGDAEAQVREAVGDEVAADAVFVSCTNYRTFAAVADLEASLGVPVVTSNTATLWDALRAAGAPTDCVPGHLGRITGR
ncbi:maleate cis-trans isomerase family protein [Haloarchaeobius amylolyticus]|uniref:maleate cis-trans isomerase family protein n=1 Tax=Haloarchaeobius amylolyticus TaxID=1198296 RepID=UPI002270629A|nr:aspartate/glutamate racemase family protein [Haloarchaeobius amylolyticus]